MKTLSWGGQFLLLLALWVAVPALAQSPKDAGFLSTLGGLRDASYDDKAKIVEQISSTGHPSVRAVLTALMEQRLYFRNSDQKIFIGKTADVDPLNIVDPLTLKSAGTAAADS